VSLSEEQKKSPDIVTEQILISGHAIGLSGFVTKLNDRHTDSTIPVRGVSAVPLMGGVSKSVIDGPASHEHAPFVSFSSIETEADGSADATRKTDKGIVNTRVTIRGLVVAGRFHIDFVQASLQLRHQGVGTQPAIVMDGTSFGSILLDDEIIRVHTDDRLFRLHTQNELINDIKANPDYYKGRLFRGPQDDRDIPHLSGSGYIMLSIANKVEVITRDPKKKPNATVQGHRVLLPGFGALRFGELMIRPESRRLTMLNLELGCSDEGRVMACAAESMGEACPP